jgi:integrase
MAPRNRSISADLPDNLYLKKINGQEYFVWYHPVTHKSKSLSKDRKEAVRLAVLLNQALAEQGITKRVPRPKGSSMAAVVKDYRVWKLKKAKSSHSKSSTKNNCERIIVQFGRMPVNQVKTKDLYDWLSPMSDYTYRKLRTQLISIFRYAINTGRRTDQINPADQLLQIATPTRKRQRMTVELYKKIYTAAPEHLQIAMDLMLCTALRPGDICKIKKSQYENGVLSVYTSKTGVLLEIEFSKLEEERIIKRANSTNILSPFIVHRIPERLLSKKRWARTKEHHTQLEPEQLGRHFKKVREGLKIQSDLPARQRTSLYEIRSLASHMYKQQGRPLEEIRDLMAHTKEKMTEHYQSGHALKIIRVKAGLKI